MADYGPGNRLKARGKTRFEYDVCGRMVRRLEDAPSGTIREWRFEWDGFDRLTGVVTPSGERWAYAYDPFGRRIRKTGPNWSAEFIWDGANMLQEKGEDRVRSWLYDPYSGRVLVQKDGDEFLSVIVDHLGTPTELVDRFGKVVWRGNHWAWGAQKETNGKWPADCPLRFPGQYEDRETGLHYNVSRYYDPASCRYISPDPIGLLGGLNEYAYCLNPVNWIDPWGLCSASDKEHVYQLVDEEGNVVYYGISNDPERRYREHAADPDKDFARMEVLTDALSHNDARNLESALIRARLDSTVGLDRTASVADQLNQAGLQNLNRGRTPERVADNGGPAPIMAIKPEGSRDSYPRGNSN
jgi:RHS repeat-associated protein